MRIKDIMVKGLGVEILSDNVTVWVNVAPYGACIGRFGRAGVDIHRAFDPDTEGNETECLLCTHGFVTREDWETFVQGMLTLHGVPVPESFMPERLRNSR